MCGIVAVVRRPGSRAVPDVGALTEELAAALSLLGPTMDSTEPVDVVRAVQRAAAGVEGVDRQLRSTAGLRALLAAGSTRPEGDEQGAPVDDLDRCGGPLETAVARVARFPAAEGGRFRGPLPG